MANSSTTFEGGTATALSRLAGLISGGTRSPLWWAALALLIFNDHVAKAAWPSWLTGKLSDVAGLVVAPVLAALLLGGRDRRRRSLAFALVVVPFTAIKIWAGAADALVGIFAAVGLPWRIVVDPTDLLALAVVPLAWLVAEPSPPPNGRLFERAGLVVGAVACLASGVEPPTFTTTAFLYNTSGEAIDVRVSAYDGDVDCVYFGAVAGDRAALSAARADFPRALVPAAFAEGVMFRLESRETLPLDGRSLDLALGRGSLDEEREFGGACGIALVQAEGMADMLVWTGHENAVSVLARSEELDESFHPWRIDLVRGASGLELVSHGPHVAAAVREIDAGSCGASAPPLAWSAGATASGTIAAIEPVSEGCLLITFESVAGAGGAGGSGGSEGLGGLGGATGEGGAPGDSAPDQANHLVLCIPAAAFPFAVGEHIAVDWPLLEGALRMLAISAGDARRLELVQAAGELTHASFSSRVVTPTCSGNRTVCEAYELAATVDVEIGGQFTELSPGQSLAVGELEVTLMRAAHVVAAPFDCEASRAGAGRRHDLVLVRR